ncbi:Divalent metal cation transporter MntH [Pseudomonas sp. MM227]|jgi:Mn2+/Fe2+ NRAMP family transporter|uniref:Nramp family divalent metal transporter n=1 Tax=unclassified Pseudomonas TaxID=196821 RepID=UPI000F06C5B1|nr:MULTISPECIES: Nramp family divalent metal transporter [unclassified Pseudomonas]MBD8594580.1 Nramp family divalent metal transporter [Pseudomonas sp. CFBP 8758]MBD8602647.1 Nramp family divalent metal transporter [Pseudomonas sp. CFBP 8771]MBD8624815.1 Nramp family divalent metal transporter [Pseudomonas sp. CFBP 13727]MBD8682651.1 Nramp family divalent metal transporter [Pseudomonas sp. CFBP 13719]MBD8730167.1 Nramp family divalent metal transporter [Pseudomonas sp. CFBP 13710]
MTSTHSLEKKAAAPTTRMGRLAKIIGPGIIAVLSWLGAGDLITSSVAGANYGYAMMWVLAVSLLLRFLIVNIIARFQLCNNQGMTILQGYAQLHPFFAWFMLGYALIMGHLTNAYMIKGAGEALATLLHINQPLLASFAVVLGVWLLVGRNIYSLIEGVMKGLLALMTLAFMALAIMSKPDVGGILAGTIGFSIPPDEGVHGALLVAVSVIGAVAGSIANFVHPYVMRQKGWVGPEHKRIQRNDLLFAVFVGIIINLAIWVVGAEILRPNGIEVKTLDDLGSALQMFFGTGGWLIFFVGVFATLFASIAGKTTAFPMLITDAFQHIRPERREKYGKEFHHDPMHKWFMLFILVTPLVWSLPGMPDFVTLTIGVNALNIIGLPVISLGLLIMSNQKKLLGKYRNNWFENIALGFATILAVWVAFQLGMQLLA